MEVENNKLEEQKYIRAKKKVENLKSFYIHLTVYIFVNLLISISKIVKKVGNGETFEEAFFDLNTFGLMFLWGVPLVLHAFKVMNFNVFLSKEWEERKVKEYMDE